jgi:hypothetical protein
MVRRVLMSIAVVAVIAVGAWAVTKMTSTEVTTVGVTIRKAPAPR